MRLLIRRGGAVQGGIAVSDVQGLDEAAQAALPAGVEDRANRRSSRNDARSKQDAGEKGALASLGFKEAGGACSLGISLGF